MYRSLYILFLSFILLGCLASDYNKNHCLDCHKPHYVKIGDCYFCHQGNQLAKDKYLAHKNLILKKFSYFRFGNCSIVSKGRKIVNSLGCRRCHKIEGIGNSLARSLDDLDIPFDVNRITFSIIDPAYYMPNFFLSKAETVAIVNYLMYCSQKEKKKDSFSYYKVYFLNNNAKQERIFDRKCGKCHKVLTKKYGGLGQGDVAPNLSGLFTRFYPKSSFLYPLSDEKLKKWIRNPKKMKPNTLMIPVLLDKKEIEEVIKILKP